MEIERDELYGAYLVMAEEEEAPQISARASISLAADNPQPDRPTPRPK